MPQTRGPRSLPRRIVDFLSIFGRSRRGLLGVGILVFFLLFATVGTMLTPYDPIRGLGNQAIGGTPLPPVWYSLLTPGLSQNMNVIADPTFSNPSSIAAWKTDSSSIVPSYSSDTGVGSPLGSLKLTYARAASSPAPGSMLVRSYVQFHYPYQGPEAGFRGTARFRITGIDSAAGAGPVHVNVFLEEVGRADYNLTSALIFNTDSRSDDWNQPTTPISSDNIVLERDILGFTPTPGINLAEKLFRKEADYKLGVEILIRDTSASGVNIQVYIDNFSFNLLGTSWGILGTTLNQIGPADMFTQLAYGARVSLLVGILAALISIVLGLFAGLMAGYLGKFADELIMRFTDMLLVLPGLPLLLVIIAVLGPNIWNIIILISLLGWMGFARTVRSQVLSIKERPYIEASKATGAGTFHITLRHVFPNIIGLTYVSLALAVPGAIIAEAALSFLGLGDPTVPSWGAILNLWENQGAGNYQALWWVVPPGICIAAVSLSFVLIGYALDEVLNPKLRVRR